MFLPPSQGRHQPFVMSTTAPAPAPSPSPASPPNRLRFTASPNAASAAARNSIIHSSAKGWSPLQINKRDSVSSSPLKPSPDPAAAAAASPRRTSSSFKHVTKNSLVSSSPFKDPGTVQGAQSLGRELDRDAIIHERRAARPLGQAPPAASGVAATPKAAIGLGISAKPRSSSRSASGSTALPAVSGTRKVSSEKGKVAFPSASGVERKSSGGSERKVSASKENESPDSRASPRPPRASMGFKGLANRGFVSHSPFKRVPSGGLSSSKRVNESPVPSPKTIPVVKEDVFSSPSPTVRRVSSGERRRVSPAGGLRADGRRSDSSTPSPPRTSVQPNLLTPSVGPSPLSRPSAHVPLLADEITPTPTPMKSSMTPSRRLRGPRDLSEPESPSRGSKTVTFQSVPDVKEFERMSVEGSADGSFEVQNSDIDGDDWEDDAQNGSFEELLLSPTTDKAFALPTQETRREISPTLSSEEADADQSTTADFVNTLIEEGLFSPPDIPTPVLNDQPAFELPSDDERSAPFLATPSLGDSVHATPMLANCDILTPHEDKNYEFPDKDSSGIPYGRSHHVERAVLAHALPPVKGVSPLGQPDFPHEVDHHMLMNGDAARPALPQTLPTGNEGPHARQSGLMPDPFITIDTATKVLSPDKKPREEDGVPLGRTSHHERMQAARMLATQGLGLGLPGMPRSPGLNKDLFQSQPAKSDTPPTPPADFSREMLFDASFEERDEHEGERKVSQVPEMKGPKRLSVLQAKVDQQEAQDTNRGLTKLPPKPEPVGLPSPVTTPKVEAEKKAEKRSSKYELPNFSLPSIGISSPLFGGLTGTVPSAPIPDVGPAPTIIEQPLTPPRKLNVDSKQDSPHRIPSFEFEEISLQAVESKPMLRPASLPPPVTAKSAPFHRSTSDEKKMPESTSLKSLPALGSSSSGEFGAAASSSGGSTTTRVRQRISREMIKETVQQRLAEGSLTRKSPIPAAESRIMEAEKKISAKVATATNVDKSLPPPPPPKTGEPMVKAKTTDSSPSRQSVAERPTLRPRSQTTSAQKLLEQNSKDGVIREPQSALDKLAQGMRRMELDESTSSTGSQIMISTSPTSAQAQPFPVSILQKPKEAPVSLGQAVEDLAGPSKPRRRRSLSVGNVDDEVPTPRRALKPRLTLGIKQDQQSMLDAFEEEISSIDLTRKYKVREKQVVSAVYGDTVSHSKAGDLDSGRAWRQLRRPSDMNEHAAEIRQMREREVSAGKATGTIFVKVLGIEGLSVPMPPQPTFFCITLDNGIDYIRTPYLPLAEGARVNQEFSLVEHPNFEFSLSLDVRRDPHILQALHANDNRTHHTPTPPVPASPVKSSGFRSLFSSPRKPKPSKAPSTAGSADSRSATPLPAPPVDNIAKYFPTANSSTIAKTHVAFKPIAKNCEAKVLEIRYPMFAMFRGEPDRTIGQQPPVQPPQNAARKQIAKITLQIFRLPPIPGLKVEEMPQCIDECLRGIRHHAWHEHEYHEGVLTQEGGDCTHPKRRIFKLIGGNLVAMNEVTKKHVASIDLRQAVGLVDLNAVGGSPKSRMTLRRGSDEGMTTRPRSFEIEFKDGDGIIFAADTEAAKKEWMTTLEGLIGKIPSNPLWAELLAAQMREQGQTKTKRSTSTRSISASGGQRRPSGAAKPRPTTMHAGGPSQPRKSSQAAKAEKRKSTLQ